LLADFLLVFKPGRSVSLSQWNVHQLPVAPLDCAGDDREPGRSNRPASDAGVCQEIRRRDQTNWHQVTPNIAFLDRRETFCWLNARCVTVLVLCQDQSRTISTIVERQANESRNLWILLLLFGSGPL
jgi:hypothetical protein